MFQRFDRVDYVGSKLTSELHSKVGNIISKVEREKGAYVVEFGDDAFIVSEANLRKHVATAKEEKETLVLRTRKYDVDDD